MYNRDKECSSTFKKVFFCHVIMIHETKYHNIVYSIPNISNEKNIPEKLVPKLIKINKMLKFQHFQFK